MKIFEVAQFKTFYKAYNPGDIRRIRTGDDYWDSKMFVASDLRSAEFYGTHMRVFDAPDARIIYEGTRPFISLMKGLPKLVHTGKMSYFECAVEIVKRAEAAGYDAVWFLRQSDLGTVVIHPEKFIERPAQ